MSKILSLKMRDDIYAETETITKKTHTPRNAYINAAVALYNKLHKRAMLKKQLAEDSKLVRDNSIEVLEIFDSLDEELSA